MSQAPCPRSDTAPGASAARNGEALTTTSRSRRSTARSEERRVGKECRSLCDWSSDVCSSDLDAPGAVSEIGYGAWGIGGAQWGGADDDESIQALNREIGRASCRERV